MKILQLCPLWFPIARDAHGGIETFVSQLVSALETLGCEITVLGTGDSRLPVRLLPVAPVNVASQMKEGTAEEYGYYEQHQLQIALQRADDFDLVHSHIGPGGYVLSAVEALRNRVLHTVHTPVYKDMEWFAALHPNLWLSTVSEYQARKLWQRGAKRCRVIHNGIEPAEFPFRPAASHGLVFMGRMEWVKGPDLAVQVAQTLGCPLSLAGPIVDQRFYERNVQPFLGGRIRYVGIVDHAQKGTLFGQAGCVVLPFRREEPFGLVGIEAMACGTPVVSLARGALPEIVDPGVTGYLAESEDELAGLVQRAMDLDRAKVRQRAVERFGIGTVARQYHQLYTDMIQAERAVIRAS
jgi:glycosyltransferase involved in cell wall biosynthesis